MQFRLSAVLAVFVRGFNCRYIPSRCGQRPPKNPPKPDSVSQYISTFAIQTPRSSFLSATPNTAPPLSLADTPTPGEVSQPVNLAPGPASTTSPLTSFPTTATTSSRVHYNERLVKYYISKFHPVHPILLPHSLYATQGYPDYLQVVVQFVGSHYASSSYWFEGRFNWRAFEAWLVGFAPSIPGLAALNPHNTGIPIGLTYTFYL
ncbi:hypothetical protein BDV37DRAFT_289181 [Aspergillus pseudonomiae]|uniref:Uncharacterized protein n=1 Tax=Aspergillus pseudonomiae TaxID=1506151 RepID=A0A5N7CU63_9EURO|nr:uncharacterized protein BDV37DRAFT_289181 [Aspergillus pseudonomiae]KAE8397725.1 hypothetical protein BDV37DRAFT_289181 [Aspergillus pseudonomiae]